MRCRLLRVRSAPVLLLALSVLTMVYVYSVQMTIMGKIETVNTALRPHWSMELSLQLSPTADAATVPPQPIPTTNGLPNPWKDLIVGAPLLRLVTPLPVKTHSQQPRPKEFVKEPHTLLKTQEVLDENGHILHPRLPRVNADFNDVVRYTDLEADPHVVDVIRAQAVYRRTVEIVKASLH